MSFALLSDVKKFIAGPSGESDGSTLTEIINSIRQEWYSWYEKLPMFRFAQECFEVQDFPADCTTRCDETYRGFTMPNDFAALEALWFDDRRVEFHDRWRQWQYGMTSPCDCGLKAVEVGKYSTERDLEKGRPSRIVFSALDSRDRGKSIDIVGTTINGVRFRQRYQLLETPQCTDEILCSLAQQGGIMKDMTEGRVVIAEENGRVLSILNPADTIPQFRRVKVTGLPDSCGSLNVRAARRFMRLYDDRDVVETDNEPAWAAMARAHRLTSKSVKGSDDLRSMLADKQLAEAMLRGENTRELGKSVQIDVRVPMAPFARGRHALNRTRRY